MLYPQHLRRATAVLVALLAACKPSLCTSAQNDSSDEPNCTFEDGCPQCFADAIQPAGRRNATITASDLSVYSMPFTIARRTDSAASALAAHIFGLLSEEQLGNNVVYVPCDTEIGCNYAVNGCAGWQQDTCRAIYTSEDGLAAYSEGRKVFPDPVSDIMYLPSASSAFQTPENFEGTGINVVTMPTQVVGPTGYSVVHGIYAFPEVVEGVRRTHGLDVLWFEVFTSDQARELLHSPSELDAFGVQPLASDTCNSSDAQTQAAMTLHLAQGWTREGVWWLNPSCAALGNNWFNQCLVVVDDSWENSKASLWLGLVRSDVPIAKQVVSADSWWQLVYLSQLSVVFIWWKPSAMLEHRGPERLHLRDEPTAEIVVKVASVRAIESNNGFRKLAFSAMISVETLTPILRAAGEAMAAGHAQADEDLYYRKLACDWARANRGLWSSWVSGSLCPAGYVYVPEIKECEPCGRGRSQSVFPNGTMYCFDCPPGKQGRGPTSECAECSAGRFSNSTPGRCRRCPPGYFSTGTGNTVCEACVAGRIAPAEGTETCLTCGPGFTAGAGATQCEACEPGFYANDSGLEECTSCGPQLVTILRGATQPSECVCVEDTLREVGSSTCVPCPEHFRCRPGSSIEDFTSGIVSQLTLQPGYMSRLEDPLQIYRCSPPEACPGIEPGACGPYRDPDSVACGLGLPDTYEDDEGFHKCASESSDGLLLAVIIIGCVTTLILFSFAISRDFQDQTNAGLLATALCGVSFSAFQTMGMFNSLAVTWFEPLKTIFSIISLASLDLKYLRLGCLTDVSPTATYATRQMVAPCSIPVMLVSLLLKKCSRKPVDLIPELVNVVGAVFSLLFTSIIISSATPFICYPHPVGGKSSMVSETSILCFEDANHWAMVAVGICSLTCISVPFLAISAYGTLKYPMLLASPLERHARMLRAFRFLYLRFRPECHFYGLVMSMRSVCICLVPVLPGLRDDAALQFCFLAAILTTFIMIQLWIQPWRSLLANVADGVLMNCNLQLLVCAAISTDFTDKSAIGKFGTVVFSVFSVLVVGGCIAALRWYLIPTPFYNYFICHHKAGAAAQARLLKIHIQELTKATVFIDSDDLKELDALFDIVKTKVGQLVVYLTRETLMRPWCAGEVCTAVRAKKKVLVIRTPGFVEPTELELQNLRSYIDLRGCNLSQYGIALEDVADAFRTLLSESMPVLELPVGDTSRWMAVATSLVKRGKKTEQVRPSTPATPSTPSTASTPSAGGNFIISAERNCDESCASAAIVKNKIRSLIVGIAETTSLVCLSDFDQADLRSQLREVAYARSVCVLLSAGSLTCVAQVFVMVQIMLQEGTDIIPVRLPGFHFPEDTYFTQDLHDIWPGRDKSVAEEQMRAFFKRIAVNLEIAGSDSILNRQIDDIFSRVRTGKLPSRSDIPQPIVAALDNTGRTEGRFRQTVERVQKKLSVNAASSTTLATSLGTPGDETLWPGNGVEEQVSCWRSKRYRETL